MHKVQILLIFLGCCRAKADRISKIIGSKPRHNGIKINDTQALIRFFVKEDIIQLCVIVRNTKRQNSRPLLSYKYSTVLLPLFYERDLLLTRIRTVFQVSLNCDFEVLETFYSVVEIRNRLMQIFCRIVFQTFQKLSKALSRLIELFRLFYLLIAHGIGNEIRASPRFAFRIFKIVTARLRLNISHGLSVRISAFCPNHPS